MIKLRRISVENFLLHIFMVIMTVFMIGPFIWMISTSFKTPEDSIRFPPTFIPRPLTWDNYREIFVKAPMVRYFLNSIIYTVLKAVPSIFFCSLAGYIFAKLRFPGREVLFVLIITTMMIPFQVKLLPLYNLMVIFNWVDTYQAVIVPGIMGPFGIFFFRQSILNIPNEIIDAAKIDGCGAFTIYWRVIMPQLKTNIATFAIFTFMWGWTTFLWPLIVISTDARKPLEVGLTRFTNMYYTEYGLMTAAAFVAVLPILIFYLLMQNQFTQGITLTGLKG